MRLHCPASRSRASGPGKLRGGGRTPNRSGGTRNTGSGARAGARESRACPRKLPFNTLPANRPESWSIVIRSHSASTVDLDPGVGPRAARARLNAPQSRGRSGARPKNRMDQWNRVLRYMSPRVTIPMTTDRTAGWRRSSGRRRRKLIASRIAITRIRMRTGLTGSSFAGIRGGSARCGRTRSQSARAIWWFSCLTRPPVRLP